MRTTMRSFRFWWGYKSSTGVGHYSCDNSEHQRIKPWINLIAWMLEICRKWALSRDTNCLKIICCCVSQWVLTCARWHASAHAKCSCLKNILNNFEPLHKEKQHNKPGKKNNSHETCISHVNFSIWALQMWTTNRTTTTTKRDRVERITAGMLSDESNCFDGWGN